MAAENVKARVAKGVKWLDKESPDWHNKVDLRTLDMSSGTQCMIGQCFGDYFQKLQELFPAAFTYGDDKNENKRNKWSYDRGFTAELAGVQFRNGAWERLGLAWADVLYKRLLKDLKER